MAHINRLQSQDFHHHNSLPPLPEMVSPMVLLNLSDVGLMSLCLIARLSRFRRLQRRRSRNNCTSRSIFRSRTTRLVTPSQSAISRQWTIGLTFASCSKVSDHTHNTRVTERCRKSDAKHYKYSSYYAHYCETLCPLCCTPADLSQVAWLSGMDRCKRHPSV